MRSDAEQLAELRYESHFERRMGLWENFGLGFTYLSPVVGVYDVAEEVPDPGVTIPRAMRRTIYIGSTAPAGDGIRPKLVV